MVLQALPALVMAILGTFVGNGKCECEIVFHNFTFCISCGSRVLTDDCQSESPANRAVGQFVSIDAVRPPATLTSLRHEATRLGHASMRKCPGRGERPGDTEVRPLSQRAVCFRTRRSGTRRSALRSRRPESPGGACRAGAGGFRRRGPQLRCRPGRPRRRRIASGRR